MRGEIKRGRERERERVIGCHLRRLSQRATENGRERERENCNPLSRIHDLRFCEISDVVRGRFITSPECHHSSGQPMHFTGKGSFD